MPRQPGSRLGRSWVVELIRRPLQVGAVLLLAVLVFIAARNLLPQMGQPAAYPPEQFVRQLLFGLAQGSIYALLALGYSMVYSVLAIVNLAHGEVFMAGAYFGVFAMLAAEQSGLLVRSPLLALSGTLVVGVLASIVITLVLERYVYRPVRGAERVAALVVALGASVTLQQLFALLFGSAARRYPEAHLYAFSQSFADGTCADGSIGCAGIDLIGGRYDVVILGLQLRILPIHAVVLVIAIGLILCLGLFIYGTRSGRAMRAVSDDPEMAAMLGVDVRSTIVIAFVLGAILAGAAGVLYALYNRQVTPFMGFLPGLKALTAAMLGGIGHLPGTALGGFILGIVESTAPSILGLSAQLKDAVAFVILVLVIILRPQGLFTPHHHAERD